MRKAQANTFWIIIGAVIALIVLVVLLLMFTGKTNVLEQGLADCEAKGGSCQYTSGEGCPNGMIKQSFFDCDQDINPGAICCIGSSGEDKV
mgnify:CR=1 FL=1